MNSPLFKSLLFKVEEEKVEKDEQIRQMREELAHQEELVAKLSREKRGIADSKLKEEEGVQATEDKCNHLNKLKAR